MDWMIVSISFQCPWLIDFDFDFDFIFNSLCDADTELKYVMLGGM
jgi:hypothetical protein